MIIVQSMFKTWLLLLWYRSQSLHKHSLSKCTLIHWWTVVKTPESRLLASAMLRISLMWTPLSKAAEVVAPLTECALNTSVLTPASFNRSLIRWAKRWVVTGLWGLTLDRKSGAAVCGVTDQNWLVVASYCFKHWTTHSLSFAEKLAKDISFKGTPVWRFLVSEANLNTTPLTIYRRKRRSMACSSDTLLALARDHQL